MKAEQLLKRSGLSRTQVRLHIIDLLSATERPLSGMEIQQKLALDCDKSTIYRTLNALYEKALLSRVIVEHEVKYALRPLHLSSGDGSGDHVHFKCDICSRVYCMKELQVDDFDLPEGFIKSENQFLIIGTCRACSEQQRKEP